jgi:threonine dehydrogenase-like Zn-dependent dehydrogenase
MAVRGQVVAGPAKNKVQAAAARLMPARGAALLGYTSLYGPVPGGQAQYLRVPDAFHLILIDVAASRQGVSIGPG